MHAVTTAELLGVWERGLAQRPIERALEILRAAGVGASIEEIAAYSVGERDRLLLTLREWLFGADIGAVAFCPRCREKLELNFSARDLLTGGPSPEDVAVSGDGFELRLRPITSADLLAADSRETLLRRAVVAAHRSGDPVSVDALPAELIEAAVSRLAASDPHADIQIAVECPGCGHSHSAPFDVVSFLWSEIEAWAVRMLREVHTLASAYGWREADILALSPTRREFYLELASA